MQFSWKAGVATVAAAFLLVAGVDYATLAATGDSLILGRVNTAAARTTIVSNGSGPALSLKSRGNDSPSLRVSSDAKVPSLNADMVDGRQASELATRAVTYRAGHRNEVIAGGFGAWDLPNDPGAYQVTFKAVAIPTPPSATPPAEMICGVVDLDTIGARTRIYTADSGSSTGALPIAMSGAAMVRIKASSNPGFICVSNNSDFVLFKPVSISLTPITSLRMKIAPQVAPRMGPRLGAKIWQR